MILAQNVRERQTNLGRPRLQKALAASKARMLASCEPKFHGQSEATDDHSATPKLKLKCSPLPRF